MEKKKILIGLGIAFVFCFALLIGFFFKSTSEKKDLKDDKVEPNIPVETIQGLYERLKGSCEGGFVLDFHGKEEVEIAETSIQSFCDSKAIQKLFGYTDIENGVAMDVKVLKEENGLVYTLEQKEVGSLLNSDELLDQGTTIRYLYQKVGDQYQLVSAIKE